MLVARFALLGAAVAVLAGCGGGRSPEQVARTYVGGEGPARCDAAAQAFLERQTGRRGDAAREACLRAAERLPPPAGVRVTGTTERGDRAEVALEAGGQDVLVRLERRRDRWLVTGLGR